MKFDLANIIKKRNYLDQLRVPFTKEEIDKVISQMPGDKSPGPDGFNAAFLKSCWEIIAPDFYKLIADFHEGNINMQSINYSFITLIPKKDSAAVPSDFRPNSLLNCPLKISTKMLANRLHKIFGSGRGLLLSLGLCLEGGG